MQYMFYLSKFCKVSCFVVQKYQHFRHRLQYQPYIHSSRIDKLHLLTMWHIGHWLVGRRCWHRSTTAWSIECRFHWPRWHIRCWQLMRCSRWHTSHSLLNIRHSIDCRFLLWYWTAGKFLALRSILRLYWSSNDQNIEGRILHSILCIQSNYSVALKVLCCLDQRQKELSPLRSSLRLGWLGKELSKKRVASP